MLKEYELFDIYKRSFFRQYRLGNETFRMKGLKLEGMTEDEREAVLKNKPVNFLFSPASAIYAYGKTNEKDEGRSPRKFSEDFSLYLRTIGIAFEELRSVLRRLSYIGPLRDRPRRYYEVAGEIPRTVGTRGEHTANLLRKKFKESRKEINSWIRRFEFGDSLLLKQFSESPTRKELSGFSRL